MMTLPAEDQIIRLRQAGASRMDAVGWHYIEALAQRTRAQHGIAKALLQDKLQQALDAFEIRLQQPPQDAPDRVSQHTDSSPLATLLQEMQSHSKAQASPALRTGTTGAMERPHVRQFRKQLRRISVQKQVSQALAQAPRNAGPINSHMLVLRALGLMRDISPDYLNRFMTHVDTLLCLDESGKAQSLPRKQPRSRPQK